MEFIETVFLVMGPLLMSFIFFAATFTGWAWNRKVGYGIAALFLVIGVCMGIAIFLKAEILVVFIIALPFGGFVSVMGLGMIADVFLYRKKCEGQFVGTTFAHRAKGGIVYHSLIFTYRAGSNILQNPSDDYYKPEYIKKHYETRQTYPIWVNPKKPEKFRVKRLYRLAAGFMAAFIGLSFLWVPFDMLL